MKKWSIVFAAWIAVLACMTGAAVPVYAAEGPEISVPVTISLSGTLPHPAETFTVLIKADAPEYPMPHGTVDGICSMTITGEDTKHFPAITYGRVGVYTYKVYQIAGANEKCTYDDIVYTLTVTVSNRADYNGLEVTAVIHPDSEGAKVPGVLFENKYKVESPPDPPRTGDEAAPVLYAVLIVVSMGVIAGLLLTRKRKHTEE